MPSSSVSESPESPLINSPRVPAIFFAATILLSAFLLFQVQPLIAKLILPWFGGSAAVWTSCMLFFQMALLAGYAYAHWLNGQPERRQTVIHIALLVLSLATLPILPSPWWKPTAAEDPLLRILGLLTATVGLPYFLLSSTSPLLQTWYSRSNGGALPYRFFALSNAGSMLGLLAYPVLVEPYLTAGQQAWSWSIGFGAFVLVCATVAFRSRRGHEEIAASPKSEPGPAPAFSERLLWMGLAACASGLLLAVTNHLTQNVAAIPFLWVLPLSLYLLSFILCFDSDRWYLRPVFGVLGVAALGGMAYLISQENTFGDLKRAVGLFCAALFVLFMVCHGELARRRPSPAYLTGFYLMVSVGGALGGLFIGFAAPYFFNALYDLQVMISVTGFVLLWMLWRDRGKGITVVDPPKFLGEPHDKPIVYVLAGGLFGYSIVRLAQARFLHGAAFLNGPWDGWMLLGLTAALAFYVIWRTQGTKDGQTIQFAVALGLAIGIAGFLARDTWRNLEDARLLVRNFYGALEVYDDSGSDGSMGPFRVLRHGTIDHGEQFLWPQNRRWPTTYYAKGSGVGLAIQTIQMQGPMHVGVIGLGAGTLTTYARPIDKYRVYDINPLVLKIAQTQFTFLLDCMAPHKVVLGDARLSLESELKDGPLKFDVLAVDAFSGDAIPVHLLTREAFSLYWKHLNPDGVLAVHVSNRYLSLGPVVALGAAEDHKTAKMVSFETSDRDDKQESDSDWVLVTSRPGFFEQPELKVAHNIDPIPNLRMWTDDYSNLYKILR
jgi:hypothetical protein